MELIEPRKERLLPLASYPSTMRRDQVAAYFGCSQNHIINLVNQGKLAPAPGSKGNRISKVSIEQFEQAWKVKASKAPLKSFIASRGKNPLSYGGKSILIVLQWVAFSLQWGFERGATLI